MREKLKDVGIALVVAVMTLGGGHGANERPFAREHVSEAMHLVPIDAVGYLLLAIGPAALLLRRRFPITVLLVALAASALFVARGHGFGPVFLPVIIAFLTAATTGSRWRTYPIVPLGYSLTVWPLPALLGLNPPPNWWEATGIAAWLTVLIAVAEGIRLRRAVLEARRARAEAAQHEEQEQRRRRASEERLAIARELHDVLGHSLSMIHVQSSVALELMDRKPEQAATALAAIRDASRDALGEVHSLLKSIRADVTEKSQDAIAPTAPVPGIANLDAVVAAARTAGLAVATTVTGTRRRLPALVDAAAARIVRESLTNVARHAPGSDATVTVGYLADAVLLRIDNTASAVTPSAVAGGLGIAGMMERAHALGGELTARGLPGGGFRVDARLPATAME